MLRLKVFLLLILHYHVHLVVSKNSGLTELIEKAHYESNSATVYFIRFEQEFLSEFLKTHPEIPVTIIRDLEDDWQNFNTAILVVQGLEIPHSKNHRILEVLIEKIHVRKFVIISAVNLENLKLHFKFFMENKFTRILGVADNIVYAFLPYADNQIERLSSPGFLPRPQNNLNGLIFRTTIQTDIPRTFAYIDKRGRRQLGGCFGQLFATFLQHYNATYRDIRMNNSSQLNIPAIINATLRNIIDISFNAHPQIALDWSYPVKVVKWVMLVPINGYVNPHEYFKRPFKPTAWICIGLALVYITMMKVLLNKFLQKPLEVWHSFSQTFLALLMLSSEKPITSAYRLYLQIFLFSFIIGNIYVIFLTSFLTAFIRIRQFDSMADLIEHNFPILVSKLDWRHLTRPDGFPKEFTDLFVGVDHSTYYQELHSMKNTSYAYGLGNDRRDFLINMQASLVKPLFRRAQEEISFYLVGYILPHHSPFKDILNDFVIRVKETGLMLKWDADTVRQAPMAGFTMDFDRHAGEKPLHIPLTLHHLEFAWSCAGGGWSIAILCFLGEWFYSRCGF